jgi:hypothetical protein
MNKWQVLTIVPVALALIAAYVVVTVTGSDGNGLLGALLGWLAGGGATAATSNTKA